jgi:hypothetical protein
MDRPQDRTNLQKNLVLLVESCSSVAGLCRTLDINRQQFNKYLAGQHAPSHKVLQKISRHFMMEVPDLYRQPADFKQFYEGFESELPMGLRSSSQFATFLPFAKASVEPLRDYLGVYYRYHNSSIYKGRILRSVTCLYEAESTIQHVTVERFPLLDGSGKTGYSFTYYGFCFLIGDRIFMVDFEGQQQNELTFSILTASCRAWPHLPIANRFQPDSRLASAIREKSARSICAMRQFFCRVIPHCHLKCGNTWPVTIRRSFGVARVKTHYRQGVRHSSLFSRRHEIATR